MNRQRSVAHPPTHPAAFTLLEMLLALSFLALAAGLILKTHQTRMDFDRDSMERLACQFKIENIAERLSLASYEGLPDATKQVNQGNDVIAKIDSFESENGNGWHVQIRSTSDDQSLTQHLWKWEPKP